MQLNNQNILITGGTKGLGKALAEILGARGARVAIVARNEAEVDAVTADLIKKGVFAHGIVADIGAPDAAARIAGEAHLALGPIDVLIQNASTLGPTPLRPLLDLEPEALLRVFEVNVLGPFRLGRQIVGAMAARGRGTVLSISSDAAVEAYPTWGGYGASKAALDHLHRVWAAELEARGVKMLVLDPGEMATEMHAAALPDADPSTLSAPEAVAQGVRRILEASPTDAPVRQVVVPEAVMS